MDGLKFDCIFQRLYNERLFKACRLIVVGFAGLTAIVYWPSIMYIAIALAVIYATYRSGLERGWVKALKLAYDAECGTVHCDGWWEEDGASSPRRLYEQSLRQRLQHGGAKCGRCGWKSGDDSGGVPTARFCCVCFARMGASISSKRYVLLGTGPYCSFHFEEAKRIVAGELRTYTWNRKSDDELETADASAAGVK